MATATAIDKGHGRRERRTLETTTWLNEYRDWPDVGPVFRPRRERTIRGTTTVEEVIGITSLPRAKASAGGLLRLIRSHWAIENQSFGVRDVTRGEDACRVRTGAAAQVMAAVRDAALFPPSRTRKPSTAPAMRDLRFHPRKAIDLATR